jgi:hypothetical protein
VETIRAAGAAVPNVGSWSGTALLLLDPTPSVDVDARHELGTLLGTLYPRVEVEWGQLVHRHE